MMFLTPRYWHKKTWLGALLLPFSYGYLVISTIYQWIRTKKQADIPVICVGNITAGGAGKTPVCIWLYHQLVEQGHRPAFVSRGYGGTLSAVQVNPKIHTAHEVGDEPLLLAKHGPVFIARDRHQAVKQAKQWGATLVIMDDGLQNKTIAKDLSILVIDGLQGIGNGWLLPSGPLRQKLRSAERQTQLTVLIGEDKHHIRGKLSRPPVYAQIKPHLPSSLLGASLVAFAGIGYPEKFFQTLHTLNVKLCDTIAFPDHYPFSERDMQLLLKQAREKQAQLITTEKDFLRVPQSYRQYIQVLPITIEVDSAESRIVENALKSLKI